MKALFCSLALVLSIAWPQTEVWASGYNHSEQPTRCQQLLTDEDELNQLSQAAKILLTPQSTEWNDPKLRILISHLHEQLKGLSKEKRLAYIEVFGRSEFNFLESQGLGRQSLSESGLSVALNQLTKGSELAYIVLIHEFKHIEQALRPKTLASVAINATPFVTDLVHEKEAYKAEYRYVREAFSERDLEELKELRDKEEPLRKENDNKLVQAINKMKSPIDTENKTYENIIFDFLRKGSEEDRHLAEKWFLFHSRDSLIERLELILSMPEDQYVRLKTFNPYYVDQWLSHPVTLLGGLATAGAFNIWLIKSMISVILGVF